MVVSGGSVVRAAGSGVVALLLLQLDTEKTEDARAILELVREKMLLAKDLDEAFEMWELADESTLPVSENRDFSEPADSWDMGRPWWKVPESIAASRSPRAFSKTRSPGF